MKCNLSAHQKQMRFFMILGVVLGLALVTGLICLISL